ncbi:MAG: hypothetical protein ACQCN5_11570 [Candidatus Bathyarchaeia archaeon]|jgi:hypothetical protein
MKTKIMCIFIILSMMVAAFPALAQSDKIAPESSELTPAGKLEDLMVEPSDAFEIPPEVKANMTKEEIYALKALPGYFKPLQESASAVLRTNPQPVKAIVSVDDDMRALLAAMQGVPYSQVSWEDVYAWAYNILEGGDDYLELDFGIDIQAEVFTYWETPSDYDIYDMIYTIDDIDPTGVGCDIFLLMSAQINTLFEPSGLAWRLGRHFVMTPSVGAPANLFQHEASHLFGPYDHDWNPLIYCIMSYAYTFSTRDYCTACFDNIDSNKNRFD